MIQPCDECHVNPWGGEQRKGGGVLCNECARLNPELIDRPRSLEDAEAHSTTDVVLEPVELPKLEESDED